MHPPSTFVVGYDNRSLADVFFTHKWLYSIFKYKKSYLDCSKFNIYNHIRENEIRYSLNTIDLCIY